MNFPLFITLACISALAPLGIATMMRVKTVDAVVAGFLSGSLAVVEGNFICRVLDVDGTSPIIPGIFFGGVAVVCFIWTALLFLIASEQK
jgi:hypothetical protein